MNNVVISYPKISKIDFDWIQNIRKAHDKQYEIVNPHVTFVFPSKKLGIEELITHVESKVSREFKITIELAKAIVNEDYSKKYFHVFLVPSIGKGEIIKLHDLLYVGNLKSELRLDIPFIPHLGIATCDDKVSAQALADMINAETVHIKGFLDVLTVASFDGKKVVDLRYIQLH